MIAPGRVGGVEIVTYLAHQIAVRGVDSDGASGWQVGKVNRVHAIVGQVRTRSQLKTASTVFILNDIRVGIYVHLVGNAGRLGFGVKGIRFYWSLRNRCLQSFNAACG